METTQEDVLEEEETSQVHEDLEEILAATEAEADNVVTISVAEENEIIEVNIKNKKSKKVNTI